MKPEILDCPTYTLQIFDANQNLTFMECGLTEMPHPAPPFPKNGSQYFFKDARDLNRNGRLPKLRQYPRIKGTQIYK